MNRDLDQLAVNTIRMLAVDGVQKANSGHPGMPMGMADCAFVLWTKFLRFNPDDPEWIGRDRFILSAGHGSMLLYSMLHLSGYDISMENLQAFRQWESNTPGHPEYGETPGVETTTGPLGQGFATGVGMGLAAKSLSARFSGAFKAATPTIYAIVSDGDLMEGVASEAASLAGHLGLGNLVYIYDDNHISIEGETSLTYSEDVAQRFQAYGWHTLAIDGHDHRAIEEALQAGLQETSKPTLILARTHIGFGSPNKQDKASSHGAPLGEDEVAATRKNLGWPYNEPFFVPDEVQAFFSARVETLKTDYAAWMSAFLNWKKANPEQETLWERMMGRDIPADLEETLIAALPGKPAATRALSGKVLQEAARLFPGLMGGSADLAPSCKSMIDDELSLTKDNFTARNLHFGIREHAMGSILNGLSLFGGFIPYGATFFIFTDYMRPPMRLAALMKIQAIYIFTHDSFFVGEDGPTHQPVEQLAALRIIPDLALFRPANGVETALSWAYALKNQTGPTALCLTRQGLPEFDMPDTFTYDDFYTGGYILVHEESSRTLDLVLAASGSEVGLALAAEKTLKADGLNVRVVSMPSLNLFHQQEEAYRNQIIPINSVPLVAIEAGVGESWYRLNRGPFLMLGLDHFGASAPHGVLAEKFGFTADSVAARVKEWMKTLS